VQVVLALTSLQKIATRDAAAPAKKNEKGKTSAQSKAKTAEKGKKAKNVKKAKTKTSARIAAKYVSASGISLALSPSLPLSLSPSLPLSLSPSLPLSLSPYLPLSLSRYPTAYERALSATITPRHDVLWHRLVRCPLELRWRRLASLLCRILQRLGR
jgi:hypothetical protein